ncbi:MAG: hypothetical protein Q9199_003660 [Rusavskia elegans]
MQQQLPRSKFFWIEQPKSKVRRHFDSDNKIRICNALTTPEEVHGALSYAKRPYNTPTQRITHFVVLPSPIQLPPRAVNLLAPTVPQPIVPLDRFASIPETPQILFKQSASTEVATRIRTRGNPQFPKAQESEVAGKQEFVTESSRRSSEIEECQGTYCAAEQYDIAAVANILKDAAYHLDPYETGLYPQVVHVEVPSQTPSRRLEGGGITTGDVFVFPSGTVVAWDVPESTMSFLVSRTLARAAVHPHPEVFEEEDLEYLEDPMRESSAIKGDTIILGTKSASETPSSSTQVPNPDAPNNPQTRTIDTVLTKIAFSSGLARSTKLAVLETLFSTYLSTTLSIPRLPYTRTTILQKTGQLLSLRAQLNLYSELTDSLPDLFWDSKYELGLEGYYDMVGRALDVGVRIKVLNGKLDYATEIAEVLRGQLSERHGVRLEWIIIALITVEVGFAVRQEVKEYRERREMERGMVAVA